ncbi:MAG: CapA family protein [Candidatus Bathyarchaeota archaeon]|jgi:poly-gamma-glutamate synthesis protein (capsule biosynthesis protein)
MKKISFVATGDSLITMKQSVHSEPKFLEMVELIRSADVAFTNHEMLLHDYEDGVWPSAESGGTYTRAPPGTIEELKWMGYDIVSTANNHSLDYLYGGLFSTKYYLDDAGVPHAGTGKDLAEARAPTYVELPYGRVALIAAASSFASFGRAGHARRDMQGRPGLNPLRYESWWTVEGETLETIKALEKTLDMPEVVQPEDGYHFMRQKFVVGDDVGMHTKPHEGDMEGNLESIREAARQADWVFFSLHAHEGLPNDRERPAEFIEEFARAAIDVGAHALMGHGHHAMRGIEIRDGKPIFYSLGDFIFQNETVYKMPAEFYERYKLDPYSGTPSDAFDARQDAPPRPGWPEHKWFTKDRKYWISVIPFMEFEGDQLSSLRLHPVELGQDKPRSQRGRPMFVDEEEGAEIVGIMEELSEPYGTEITIENGIGTVKV